MANVIASVFVSLDGYMTGKDDGLDWHSEQDPQEDIYSVQLLENTGAVMMGAETYRLFSSFWPKVDDFPDVSDSDKRFASLINAIPKHVFTTSINSTDWENTIIHSELNKLAIDQIVKRSNKNVVVFGGPTFLRSLQNIDAIDQYNILVHPLLLGEGKRLFSNNESSKLALKDVETFDSGVVKLVYGRKA